jgi:GNAT superfamily N-acetyltransferase
VDVGARTAVEPDRARLVELHRQATEELRSEKGGDVWARETDRDGEPPFAFDDPAVLVAAGEFDGVVVGYARVAAATLAGGDELARVSDVYVDPAFRELGVGEALLDACVAWADARGCIGIDAVVLPGMRESKNFFEAAGLVARLIVPHRRLR